MTTERWRKAVEHRCGDGGVAEDLALCSDASVWVITIKVFK